VHTKPPKEEAVLVLAVLVLAVLVLAVSKSK
jgi:hypothetical protein